MSGIVVTGYTDLMRGMRQLPAHTRKEIRGEFRIIGDKVAKAAQQNARWSKRIPPAIATSVTTKAVAVVARRARAPHVGIFEYGGRHPVFGNRDVWVEQKPRPYLRPAVAAVAPLVVPEMNAAMDRAIKKAGL